MEWFNMIFSGVSKYLLLGLSGISMLIGLYMKGRSDAKSKAQNEDIKRANNIRREGAQANARVDASIAAGELRKDDGFKRD